MKLNYIFTLLLLCQFSFAQTEKHLAVPGTKCSIVPPSGFIASDSFSGFFNAETGASIIITEIPAPYESLVSGFTVEALKSKGMTLLEKKTIDFNGSDATYFIVKQSENEVMYNKQILMFGASGKTLLVNAIYPESSKNIESALKTSLLSTIYTAGQIADPFEAVDFTVATEGTGLKILHSMPGNLLYSSDSKVPTNKPTLIVGNTLMKVSAPDKKQYAISFLRQLHNEEPIIIKNSTAVTIDGMSGYEIVAEGKNVLGSKQLIYEVMLFSDNGGCYIVVGNTAEHFDKNLEMYRTISKTFKRK